jgi:hypothetical protein
MYSGSQIRSSSVLSRLQVRNPIIRGPNSGRSECLSLLHNIQTDTAAQAISYPVCTGGSFHTLKRPETEADPSSLSKPEVKMQDAMNPLLYMPSSPGAQLNTGNLPLYVIYSSESN